MQKAAFFLLLCEQTIPFFRRHCSCGNGNHELSLSVSSWAGMSSSCKYTSFSTSFFYRSPVSLRCKRRDARIDRNSVSIICKTTFSVKLFFFHILWIKCGKLVYRSVDFYLIFFANAENTPLSPCKKNRIAFAHSRRIPCFILLSVTGWYEFLPIIMGVILPYPSLLCFFLI